MDTDHEKHEIVRKKNEQIYSYRERHQNVIFHIKLYLCGLFVLINAFALLDGEGVPYMPIELSSLLIAHYTRKAIFLASLVPVTLLMCFAKPMQWSMRGIGISFFLMALFDQGNEWFLHLLAVIMFALCIGSTLKESKSLAKERILYIAVVILYLSRILGKLMYISYYEEIPGGGSVTGRMKMLATLGCSGYTQCQEPDLTPFIFRLSAIVQQISFLLLVFVINE